jgi:hypothetical protein
MAQHLPLSTLLSQALVAFTIEFDNEAEHRLPHRTTLQGRVGAVGFPAPWLASMAMALNCTLRLPEEGLSLRELERRARTPTNLQGMQRWGHVRVAPAKGDSRPRPSKKDWIIRPTAAGLMAQQVWRPLFGVIEERWRERMGGLEVDALRKALEAVAERLDPGLPDSMPILIYGLATAAPDKKLGPPDPVRLDELPLPALMARVLTALAIEFERESPLSLAISANMLRVLEETPARVRDLPWISGVSKESLSMGMGILRKGRLVEHGKDGTWQTVWLTAAGTAAKAAYAKRLSAIERDWSKRYPAEALRAALEPLVRGGTAEDSLLFGGLTPYPAGWRAMVRQAQVLPHFPMVLHRGGYADGS